MRTKEVTGLKGVYQKWTPQLFRKLYTKYINNKQKCFLSLRLFSFVSFTISFTYTFCVCASDQSQKQRVISFIDALRSDLNVTWAAQFFLFRLTRKDKMSFYGLFNINVLLSDLFKLRFWFLWRNKADAWLKKERYEAWIKYYWWFV